MDTTFTMPPVGCTKMKYFFAVNLMQCRICDKKTYK